MSLEKDGKIIWTDRETSEVLHGFEERNILHTLNRRQAKRIGHIFRRNYFQKHVIEGKLDESDGKTGKKT
jgi:hypothetical protein